MKYCFACCSCALLLFMSACAPSAPRLIDYTKYTIIFYRTDINLYNEKRIFALESEDVLRPMDNIPFRGYYVYCNNKSRILLTDQDSGDFYLYDYALNNKQQLPELNSMAYSAITMAGNNISCIKDGKLYVYDLSNRILKEANVPPLPSPYIDGSSIDPVNKKIYYCRGEYIVYYNIKTDTEHSLKLFGHWPAISPDGKYMLYIKYDMSIYKYNISNNDNIRIYKAHTLPKIGWCYDSSFLYIRDYLWKHDDIPFYKIMNEVRPYCYMICKNVDTGTRPSYLTRVPDDGYKIMIMQK